MQPPSNYGNWIIETGNSFPSYFCIFRFAQVENEERGVTVFNNTEFSLSNSLFQFPP